MDKVSVLSPGKLVLMGEHSVIYGHPCLVAAINKRITVTIEKSAKDEWPNSKFIDSAVKIFRLTNNVNQSLKITVTSDFSANYGLGSSSAVTAATVYGLHKLFLDNTSRIVIPSERSESRDLTQIKSGEKDSSTTDAKRLSVGMTESDWPDKKKLFNLCYQVVLETQGVSSGFDVASAINGGIIYFVTGGKVIEPVTTDDLPLLVAYSGTKANTVEIVNQVKQQMVDHKAGVEEIFRNITNLVEEGKKALWEKDWPRLGTLMNFNQDYLEDLGVSTEKLDDMINAAKIAGAFGAKLSGAGGGDCMIAIVPEDKRKEISEAIKNVGGEILDVKISREGVKVE